jgi:hypothetical protein
MLFSHFTVIPLSLISVAFLALDITWTIVRLAGINLSDI